ncbi:MAG: FlgD immunoglobulin-like domain containing protein, partial [Fibrobacterota bacterium]
WSASTAGARAQVTMPVLPAVRLAVTPQSGTLSSDSMAIFTAQAFDRRDSAVSTAGLVWRVLGAIGVIDSMGLFDARRIGTGVVTAALGALSDTTDTITVTAGALVRITISPAAAAITADSTLPFTAAGYDADSNSAALPGLAWSLNGSGSISAGGHFIPDKVDTINIIASSGSVADTAGPVSVAAGRPAMLTLAPDTLDSLCLGTVVSFTVQAVDVKGNVAATGPVTYGVSDTAVARINGTGRFVPRAEGTVRVFVSASGLGDTTGIITIRGLWVEPNATDTLQIEQNNVVVLLPPGSFATGMAFRFVPADSTAPVPSGISGFAPVMDLSPSNVLFSPMALLQMPLDSATLTLAQANALRLFVYDSAAGGWDRVPGSHFDTTTGTVTASVSRLGLYAVGIDTTAPAAADRTVDTLETGASPVVSFVLNDNVVTQTVTVYYRKTGETVWQDTVITLRNDTLLLALDITDSGAYGIEYYTEVSDGTNTTIKRHTSIQSVVDSLCDNVAYRSAQYRMFSVPTLPESASVASVLAGLGPYDPEKWLLYAWGDTDYIEYDGSNIARFETGRAYWLKVREPGFTLKTGRGRTVKTDSVYTLRLAPGWNMVGSPFGFNVDFYDVYQEILNLGKDRVLFGPYAYAYDSTTGRNKWRRPYTSTGGDIEALEAWQGYFMVNLSADTLVLPIPAVEYHAASAPRRQAKLQAAENALWTLSLTASWNGMTSEPLLAGVNKKALAGLDAYDLPRPPAIEAGVSVFISHPDWKLARGRFISDIRPLFEDGESWRVTVATPSKGGRVSIAFNLPADLPAGLEVYLYDPVCDAAVNLRQSPVYSYEQGDAAARELTLLVGTLAYVSGHANGRLGLPVAYGLSQNYPNPFNPATRIRYQLPKSGHVQLAVYNVAGRCVAWISDRHLDAGYYTVNWNGRLADGSTAASGFYLYRLSVTDNAGRKLFEKQRSMVLMK